MRGYTDGAVLARRSNTLLSIFATVIVLFRLVFSKAANGWSGMRIAVAVQVVVWMREYEG